ncbi:MAG: ATP-dependent sacrificial sulfur transferase LarE [Bacteroidales bacterium]|nr:ATP-dependent sacrificial sulfur transferase LarE [Bacteroidales bacterium]
MTDVKLQKLDSLLGNLSSFVIGFSGGLDSSFLIHRASIPGNLDFEAVTIKTKYVPEREIREAVNFTSEYGISHRIIEIPFPRELRHNPSERCYLCKRILFDKIVDFARENNYKHILDGTNADDFNLYRPGLKALKEMQVRSPLAEAGLSRPEIREYARQAGLAVWEKPAMSCLLTRIPYDTGISEDILTMVEKAEDFLFEKGFPGTRVRIHGDVARIECIPGYLEKLVREPDRKSITSYLKEIGFRYVSLDLEGYRTGSMDHPYNPEK